MAEYRSKYRGEEVDALLDKIAEDNVGDIDSALSLESENPVMNKVITEELNKKANKTDIATINGQPLTNGGNIEVVTGSYDDTEIKGKLTELQTKVGEFKVKDASVSGNTLNITKEDGTILPFTPQSGVDDWQVLELNTADIPEDRILLDVGEGKIITDVDIDFAFSTNTPLEVEQEFRIGFLNAMGSGYGNILRHSFRGANALTITGKYIGEVIKVNNIKVSRTRSGWSANSSNSIIADGTGSGWSNIYNINKIYGSVAENQNHRYLQIYNYYPKDTIVFGWVRIKYKMANV